MNTPFIPFKIIGKFPDSYILKFARIFALEFVSTFLIVGCTREYVAAKYMKTALFESVWITQWFYQAKLFNEQEETRSWSLGYPAFLIGTVLGAWAGIWIT